VPRPVDLHGHAIARLQEHGRIAEHAHAAGRARRDDVAGQQRHVAADVADQEVGREDELVGVALLHHDVVPQAADAQAQPEVGQFVGRHEPGAARPAGVQALAAEELLVAVLRLAIADVVEAHVAGDVLARAFARDGAARLRDHEGDLRLGIDLVESLGQFDRPAGRLQAGAGLAEQQRPFRQRLVLLGGVVLIVQAHGDDLRGQDDRCRQRTAPQVDERQAHLAAAGQHRGRLRRRRLQPVADGAHRVQARQQPVPVGEQRRVGGQQVQDQVLADDQAGAGPGALGVGHEFHGRQYALPGRAPSTRNAARNAAPRRRGDAGGALCFGLECADRRFGVLCT
jgi:hypothetical protein